MSFDLDNGYSEKQQDSAHKVDTQIIWARRLLAF
jgi:hypothetical protein